MTALAVANDITQAPSATAPDVSTAATAYRLLQWTAEVDTHVHRASLLASHTNGGAVVFDDVARTELWLDRPSYEQSVWLASTVPWQSTAAPEHEALMLPPEEVAATFRRVIRVLKYWRSGSAATGAAVQFVRGLQHSLSWDESFNRLEEFAMLPENWDSYDAAPISAEAIAVARELLLAIMQPTPWGTMAGYLPSNVVPLADGGVQFEWLGSAAQLEVEIDGDGRMICLFSTGGGEARRSTVLNGAVMQDVVSLVSLASGAPVRWRTTW